MLNSEELFNPIKLESVIPDEFFQEYINIRNKQYIKIPTMPETIYEVWKRFFRSHEDVEKAQLREVWEPLRSMIESNEAFAKFVLDNELAESNFFFPWMLTARKSPSEAMELAYGAGWNLHGEWVSEIPEEDPVNFFVHNLPTLAYHRKRQLKIAELAVADRDRMGDKKKSKVLNLGAGRMNWARYHGFKFEPERQQIIACDKDPTIEPSVFSAMHGKDHAIYHGLRFNRKKPDSFKKSELLPFGLTYEKKDILDELADPMNSDASLVILSSEASRYTMEDFENKIVRPAYKLLRNDGGLFFDLQLSHISHEWNTKILGWRSMKLPDKALEAKNMVEAMRMRLWRYGMGFRAEYMLGIYGGTPVSIMVLLTKI